MNTGLAAYDNRPFFERVLRFGLDRGIITPSKWGALQLEGAKGVVQIADYFGTAHLRSNLDEAIVRIVYLASLYLEHYSAGDLEKAAHSLQDNSFLSHSRGGSEMLKALNALPVDESLMQKPEDIKVFLEARTLSNVWSLQEYQAVYRERQSYQLDIEAAVWFCGRMNIPRADLPGVSAETVLHAALLTLLAGRVDGRLLNAKEFTAFLKKIRKEKKKFIIPSSLLADVPTPYHPRLQQLLHKIRTQELPHIMDESIPFDDLLRQYHDHFRATSGSNSDVSDYDELLTDEWRKVTGGKTDSDSMNTIFLCLCAGKPPKPVISLTEAKTLVQAIRETGIASASVSAFINRCAPHQMVEGLLSLWQEEFLPEVVEPYLLDASDEMDTVLQILRQNCHIKRPVKKPAVKSVKI